jgi:hypothetical protein
MKAITTAILSMAFGLTGASQSENTIHRKGILFGFSAGVANSTLSFPSTTQNHTNLALNWKLGYMVRPKIGVLLNGAVSIYEYNLSDRKRLRDFGGVFLSTQYFLNDKVWVLGGIGIGTDAPVFYDVQPEQKIETEYYKGFGLISSIGYEIWKKKNFAIDLQGRLNYSSVDLPIGKNNGFTASILLGITIY